jgi:hypothetical protein
MTRGNDVAQSMGSIEPRCDRSATSPWSADHVLAYFQKPFVYVSRRGGAQGIQCPKAVQGGNLAASPSCMVGQLDKWASCDQSSARAPPYSSYKYHDAPTGRKCEESEV